MKVGDKVRCKPGFTTDEKSGGQGYKKGMVVIIKRIEKATSSNRKIAWGDFHNGIYIEALELVNTDEYEIY